MPTVTPESLLIRPSRVIDPFNRLGGVVSPTIAVIEFCQVVGPQPLASYSVANGDSSLDLDSLAVWLMSSETATGTVLCVYNQQMAVHALSYHFTIYDIRARAFQRPLCIAYLSSEKPTGQTLARFTSSVRKMISPVVVCNRRLFLRRLNDMITMSDAIENETVTGYYSLDPEDLRLANNDQKLTNVAEQARKLRPRMQTLYEHLSDSESMDSDCCGHRSEDKEASQATFMSFRSSSPLKSIKELTPCTYDQFIASLRPLLTVLSSRESRRGVLYSSGVPIFRLPKYESPLKEKRVASVEREEAKHEETLKTVCPHLDNLLFPVLAGDDMLVAGSLQRKRTVVDIVDKLNRIRPKSHPNHDVALWTEEGVMPPRGVVGVSSTKAASLQLFARENAVLDTNCSVLRTTPYQGILLAGLRQKRRFPSDASLLFYLAAVLSKTCALLYISRHLSHLALLNEGLSCDDERILANLLTEVDLVKFQGLKSALEKRRTHNLKSIQL